MRIGLREANQRFSKVIKAVRSGKDVLLTDRGRPIAVIKPLREDDPTDAALRAMADEGFIMPAAQKGPMPPPRWRPVNVKGKPLSQTIIENRDESA